MVGGKRTWRDRARGGIERSQLDNLETEERGKNRCYAHRRRSFVLPNFRDLVGCAAELFHLTNPPFSALGPLIPHFFRFRRIIAILSPFYRHSNVIHIRVFPERAATWTPRLGLSGLLRKHTSRAKRINGPTETRD